MVAEISESQEDDGLYSRAKTGNRAIPLDRTLHKRRYLVENAFGKLKDWRRIATRYDRCAHTSFSHLPCCWWYLSSQLMSPELTAGARLFAGNAL